MFQWFKDGVAVIGKNEAVLVLDCVELRNFGRYTCYVSYQDIPGEGVKSLPAILDVTPQCRNGMSEYCWLLSVIVTCFCCFCCFDLSSCNNCFLSSVIVQVSVVLKRTVGDSD